MTKERFDLLAYDYVLPREAIAQKPLSQRDSSRLLLLDCVRDIRRHMHFDALPQLLRPGDLFVLNDTRVFPARLVGCKTSGGKVELLLLHYPVKSTNTSSNGVARCTALAKGIQGLRPGARLLFAPGLEAELLARMEQPGQVDILLHYSGELGEVLEQHGHVPLPPYIHRTGQASGEDQQRYQTSYAIHPGAVAAPTAGLHFTSELLNHLKNDGIHVASLTLHVGYGTFAPVRTDDIRHHNIHSEFVSISDITAETINRQKSLGGRIWAVGTTTTRALESAQRTAFGQIRAGKWWCSCYIYPPYRFKVVDNLITNFHLPRSSLLFLVSALAGREKIMAAYEEALACGYRFFSYGDAMAILTKP